MNILNLFSLFVLEVFAANPINRGSLRVHGGRDAEPDEFPYIVSLQVLTSNIYDLHKYYILGIMAVRVCTGSALTSTWVLTAAHCFDPHFVDEMIVRYGNLSAYLVRGTPVSKVLKTIPYPHYDDVLQDLNHDVKFDIGLALTKEIPINKFGRLSAIQFTALVGLPVTFAGYGSADKLDYLLANFLPKPLQVADGGVVPCTGEVINKSKLKSKWFGMMICVVPRCLMMNQTTLHGDSGGPILYDGQIVGIVQTAIVNPSQLEHSYMINTPISIYTSWIRKVLLQK